MTRLRLVAPGVSVATSRRDSTNTVVVDGPSGALLVDPAWEADELDALARELVGSRAPAAGLSTHAHHDHLLWHPAFGHGTRWASPDSARLAVSERSDLLNWLGQAYEADIIAMFARVTPFSGTVLEWDGPEVRLLVHDAHVPGHTAAWIPSARVLIAGDMLSDVELPLLDGAVETYRSGLELLAPFAEQAALVIPGHGTPGTDGASRVAADRAYLDALDTGEDVTDPRLANEGMPLAHEANLAFAHPATG